MVFQSWNQIFAATKDEPDDLIDGIFDAVNSMIVGEPMSGKTTLLAQAAAAIARGDSHLMGRFRVRRHGPVLVLVTDGGEDRQWAKRMSWWDVPADSVRIGRFRSADWGAVYAELDRVKPALFILDNALGAIEGNVNDNDVAKDLLKRLKPMEDQGVASVVVHHSSRPKVLNRTTQASVKPMGTTAWDSWDRRTLHLQSVGPTTVATSQGNYGEKLEIKLRLVKNEMGRVGFECASAATKGDGRSDPRVTESKYRLRLEAEVLGKHPSASTQRELAKVLGVGQSTVSRMLAAFPAHNPDGKGWRLK